MDISDFFGSAKGFYNASGSDKILLISWYLHIHALKEVLTRDDIRACFKSLHVECPDLSVYLPRLSSRKPPQIIKTKEGYRLEGGVRRKLSAAYGSPLTTIPISALLTKLPDAIPDVAESDFLREALACYRVGAFRAATVMAWNLAFDHLCRYIMVDATRFDAFKLAFSVKFPKKDVPQVRTDFDPLRERDIIDTAHNAKLISKNLHSVLSEKLNRRNLAAHPSSLKIEQSQADDTISDLVNNVVLSLR